MVLIGTSSSEEGDGEEGSQAPPAAGTPVGGPGEAVPVGQRAKDDDPAPLPTEKKLRALSMRIVELLSMVTAVVEQLGKEEPEEGAASPGQYAGKSTVTADQRQESSPAERNLPPTAHPALAAFFSIPEVNRTKLRQAYAQLAPIFDLPSNARKKFVMRSRGETETSLAF
ncbi:unnamed protein product [Lampetra fluviatilis]